MTLALRASLFKGSLFLRDYSTSPCLPPLLVAVLASLLPEVRAGCTVGVDGRGASGMLSNRARVSVLGLAVSDLRRHWLRAAARVRQSEQPKDRSACVGYD